MIFRDAWDDYREELIFDFQHYFQLDPAAVFSGELDVMRAAFLIKGLYRKSGSFLQAAYFEINPRSREEQMLMAIQNTIVNTSQIKKADKKKIMIKGDKPKDKSKKKSTMTKAQQRERFAHVKIEGKENFDPITGLEN